MNKEVYGIVFLGILTVMFGGFTVYAVITPTVSSNAAFGLGVLTFFMAQGVYSLSDGE